MEIIMSVKADALFEEKLTALVGLAKKSGNVLEDEEVISYFAEAGIDLDTEYMQRIFDVLEANEVDILSIDEDEDPDFAEGEIYAEDGDFSEGVCPAFRMTESIMKGKRRPNICIRHRHTIIINNR